MNTGGDEAFDDPDFFRILDELQKDHFWNHKSLWIAKFWSVIFWGDDTKGKKQSGWTWKALEHREQILASFWKLETSLEKKKQSNHKRSSGPSWVKWLKSSKLMSKKSNLNPRPKHERFFPWKGTMFTRKMHLAPILFQGHMFVFRGLTVWLLCSSQTKKQKKTSKYPPKASEDGAHWNPHTSPVEWWIVSPQMDLAMKAASGNSLSDHVPDINGAFQLPSPPFFLLT